MTIFDPPFIEQKTILNSLIDEFQHYFNYILQIILYQRIVQSTNEFFFF